MANLQNLAFDLGETWIIDHQSFDADGTTVLDITGGSVQLFIKSAAGAQLLTSGQQTVTLTTPASGKSQIKVTPSQQTTAAISAQIGTYSIRVTLADGTVSDQNYGTFTINANPGT
jgi:hypothetical protein